MKLVSIHHADDGKHKYVATFNNQGKSKTVRFGAKGMDDYTITHDANQRDRYRARHAKDLESHDPSRPGYLSYYLLWGPSTSLEANIRAYKARFHV